MKAVLLYLLLLGLTPSLALGQAGGHIGLYTDNPGFSDCDLNEAVNYVNSIWVVHTTRADATASRFRIITNWSATFVSADYHGNDHVGGAFSGVEVTYPSYNTELPPHCRLLPYLIAELKYLPTTPTPIGCNGVFTVVAHPESGQIEAVDCDNNVLTATGGTLCVNPEFSCCLHGGWCSPLAAEETTWGAIKAMYN